jgi:glutamate 5-kinase
VAIDAGAVEALVARGRSLLAVGITTVTGNFQKGDVISLRDPEGSEVARGLTNYTAAELRQIAGQATARIAEILGHRPYEEVVHRDNMAVMK